MTKLHTTFHCVLSGALALRKGAHPELGVVQPMHTKAKDNYSFLLFSPVKSQLLVTHQAFSPGTALGDRSELGNVKSSASTLLRGRART